MTPSTTSWVSTFREGSGWSRYHWDKFGRALPASTPEDFQCDATKLGPTPSKFDSETMERIRLAGSSVKKKSKRRTSKRR